MEVIIKRITDWELVKETALQTVHKKYMGEEITSAWKKQILRSEHSPIRELKFHIYVSDVPRFVVDQIVRHAKNQEFYVQTWRPDRGNVQRSEQTMDMSTSVMISANAQSLISMASDRLCIGKVTSETRELMKLIVSELRKIEPELAFYCVPSCIRRCGCKEFQPCSFFTTFENHCCSLGSIDKRYCSYHSFTEK